MLGPVGVAGQHRLIDQLGIDLGVVRHQRVVDPKPERLERGPRQPAAMPVLRDVIDQKRFERLEEQPRTVVEAGDEGAAVAQRAAQFRQHQFRARRARTLQQPALEFGDQQSARAGFQLPEERTQLVHGRIARHHATHSRENV